MYDICIIGAGLSGLISSYESLKAGLKIITLEENPDLGGCWLTTYPDTRLQSLKKLYEWPGFKYPEGTSHYPTSQEIMAYLKGIVSQTGMSPFLNFNCRVVGISPTRNYPGDDTTSWHIRVKHTKTGKISRLDSQHLIVATGLFHIPVLPERNQIPGLSDFKGALLHSGQVDDNYQPVGKRVVVVGNGPSGLDLAVLSKKRGAKSVSIIYRKPKWIFMRNSFNPSWYYNYYFLQFLYYLHLYGLKGLNKIGFNNAFIITYLFHYYLKGPFSFPDRPISRSNIVINDYFLDYYNKGSLDYLKGNIQGFYDNSLYLEKIKIVDPDIIIMATGYRQVPNFLPTKMPLLYKYIIPLNPTLKNVYFVGFASTLANLPVLLTKQIKYIIGIIKTRLKISQPTMSEEILNQTLLSEKLGVPENDVTYNYYQYLKSLENIG